jgi:RHS repeat-associated protein
VGNRLASLPNRVYTYDAGNRLLNYKDNLYGHDANGNIVSKIEADDEHEAEGWAYEYDYENRLTKAVKHDDDKIKIVTFKYDPFGRRIEKRVEEVDEGATETKLFSYLYDDEDVLAEYDGAGVMKTRYVHGPGIDEPLAMEIGGVAYYYHADGLGSIVALSNASGRVAQAYEYDAFGRLHDRMNAIKQPYAFTGREWDKETGLYYYRARYYDPETGRFTSKDPIGIGGGVKSPTETNLYLYAGNNPVRYTDPLGLEYGTTDCSYYQRKCKETGNIYYCYAARTVCRYFHIPIFNWDQCVRQCLQEYDQKYCQDPCGKFDVDCTFRKAHRYCFRECFSDPDTQPPFPPGASPQ